MRQRCAAAGRVRVIVGAVLIVLGVAGCAGLLPRLQAPQLQLTAVALERVNLRTARVRLTLLADNPNDRAIAVRSIDVLLDLAGMPFAHGITRAPFTLPAHGHSEFALDVTVNVTNALALLTERHGQRVSYRLHGRVQLQSGLLRSVPFQHRGELQL